MFSAWGLTIKKAPNLIGMGFLALVVTLGVDKSNLYGDLEGIKDLEVFNSKNTYKFQSPLNIDITNLS